MNQAAFPQTLETPSKKIPLWILLLFCLIGFDGVLSLSQLSEGGERLIVYFFRAMTATFFFTYIVNIDNGFRRSLLPLEIVFIAFNLWSIASALFVSPDQFLAVLEVSRYMYWTLSFSFVYSAIRRYPQATQYLCFIFAVSALYYVYFTITKRGEMIDRRGDRVIGINSSYLLLFVFPWLQVYKNKLIKFLGSLIICATVFISFKRGAILTMMVMLCMMWIGGILIYRSKKMQIKFIARELIVGFFFIAGGILIYPHIQAGLEYRMMDIESGSFSGRREILEELSRSAINSTWYEIWFGNGLLSTFSVVGRVAHNDWVQVFYDLGIVGVLIFLLIHLNILTLLRSLFKKQSELFVPCVAGYTIFICKSLTGGWLHYTSFTFFLALIAVAYALNETESSITTFSRKSVADADHPARQPFYVEH